MFVVISTYRVREGEEDATIALHEHWAGKQCSAGLLSAELLREDGNGRLFVAILRFQSAALARQAAGDLAYDALLHRLASLSEIPPMHLACCVEWQIPQPYASCPP